MNIEQKLHLSQSNRCIHFFVEGNFAHIYDVSLYIIYHYFKLDLKVTVLRYKKLNYQPVLRAGLPTVQLGNFFSNLVKTRYGYQLMGDWNISEFEHWQAAVILQSISEDTA